MDFLNVVVTVAGVGLILLMAADVFQTLLSPHGTGPVCRLIMRALWLLSRRFAGRASTFAAPAAMGAVIGTRALLSIVGWAMVYLPHLPDGFVYAEGVPRRGDLMEALYISMVSLSTVGYGEVVPAGQVLRLVTAAQAVTGFGLLTATVSWILQTYPALSRRRALAHELNLFRQAANQQGLSLLDPAHATVLLEGFARNIAAVSIDLVSFNETYYFHEAHPRGSLPATIVYAQTLAAEAQASSNADLSFAGRMLYDALDDFAGVLRENFRHTGDTSDAVFQSYEKHHRHRRNPLAEL